MASRKKTKKNWLAEVGTPVVKALSPIMEDIEDSLGRAPKWVRNVIDKMDGSLCRAYNVKEKTETDKATILGIMAGTFASFESTKIKPVFDRKKVSPEMAKHLKALPSVVSPLQVHLGKLSKRVFQMMARQSAMVTIGFLNGYHRALEKKLYCSKGTVFWETNATRIYILLIMLAPVMPKIRNVSHLHKVLTLLLGEAVVGRVNDVKQSKRLGKICERIGLTFQGRGRPAKLVPA